MKWLEKNKVDFEFLSIRENNLDEDLVARWQAAVGWEKLLNRRSVTWRNIPDPERGDLDSASARRLILKYPTVMKRPVLDGARRVVVGFDALSYAKLGL